jgi:hypothetical protein
MDEEIKLEIEGVYKTNTKDLVKIVKIEEEGQMKGQMYLYNITESCHQWVSVKNHRLISKIR